MQATVCISNQNKETITTTVPFMFSTNVKTKEEKNTTGLQKLKNEHSNPKHNSRRKRYEKHNSFILLLTE